MRDDEQAWRNDRRPGEAPARRPPPAHRAAAHRPAADRPPAHRPPPAEADLVDADEEIVAGRRPVEEVFVAGRPARRLLVVPQRRGALERIVLHATSLRIPIVEVEGGTLTALAGFDGHQGVAVVVPPRRFATLDEILARAIERAEPPFVLALDSLEDPQNVGTLLRSAEAAGVHGVVFPRHRQAPLSPAAVKASAGAVEHLLLAPVDDLAAAMADLHIRGLRIAAAEPDAPMTVRQTDLRGPLAVIVGSEGQGLGPAVRRRADVLMRIPMRGAIDSLNAAVAGSILLFEVVAQRDPEGLARRRPAGRTEVPQAAEEASARSVIVPEESSVAAPDVVAAPDDAVAAHEDVAAQDDVAAPDDAVAAQADAPDDPSPPASDVPEPASGDSPAAAPVADTDDDDLLPGGPRAPEA